MGLSGITVEKLAFDPSDNKYLLTDDDKIYKMDADGVLTQLYDIKTERPTFIRGGNMVLYKGKLHFSDNAAGKVLSFDLKEKTLAEAADVTGAGHVAVQHSTGDLLVQAENTIYKLPTSIQKAEGQTVTPEIYMLARTTGMAEAKICPSVERIEPPTAKTGDTDKTEEVEETEEAEEETVAAVTTTEEEEEETEEETIEEVTPTTDDATTPFTEAIGEEATADAGETPDGGWSLTGGCSLSVPPSAPAIPASFVWLLLNFVMLTGFRIFSLLRH